MHFGLTERFWWNDSVGSKRENFLTFCSAFRPDVIFSKKDWDIHPGLDVSKYWGPDSLPRIDTLGAYCVENVEITLGWLTAVPADWARMN